MSGNETGEVGIHTALHMRAWKVTDRRRAWRIVHSIYRTTFTVNNADFEVFKIVFETTTHDPRHYNLRLFLRHDVVGGELVNYLRDYLTQQGKRLVNPIYLSNIDASSEQHTTLFRLLGIDESFVLEESVETMGLLSHINRIHQIRHLAGEVIQAPLMFSNCLGPNIVLAQEALNAQGDYPYATPVTAVVPYAVGPRSNLHENATWDDVASQASGRISLRST